LIEGHAVDTAWSAATFHCIDEENAVGAFNVREDVEKRRSRFNHRNTRWKLALREGAGDVYAYALIAEEEIAHAEDQGVHA